ncbi:MAG: RidA family protein [Spirochaetia bacterium]|nr:RidA family protein [Spirochaetia bacterium]
MNFIHTDNAPAAIGPYSQAVSAKNLLFISGQIGLDPKDGSLSNSIEKQTTQCLANLDQILFACKLSRKSIIKTTIFLKDISNFSIVNDIYKNYFGEHKPARSTVEVSNLPKSALIEIEAIAVIDES